MSNFITAATFPQRLRSLVSVAWEIFSRKASDNLLPINKEASMQLQYAYILKQLLPMVREPDLSKQLKRT